MFCPRLVFILAFSSLIGSGAVLWRDPGPVSGLDLTAAPWDSGKPPQPPFQFVKEEKGGTSPKVIVKDGAGETWYVKFGFEVKPETFSTRIVRAAGYFAPATYFVAEGTIQGVEDSSLGRAKKAVQKETGHFENARFSRKMDLADGETWSLDNRDLKGTKELAGLKLLLALLSNWDVKAPNFAVVKVPGGESMYSITDWGQTLGVPDDKSHWDCDRYRAENQRWSDGVQGGFVVLNYNGKMHDVVTNNIRVDDARWLADRIGALSDAQIRAGLGAAGATPEDVACFAPAFSERLSLLRRVAQGQGGEVRSRTVTTRTTTTTTPQK